MIDYTATGTSDYFRWKGSVAPKALRWAIPCSLLSVLCHYLIRSSQAVDQLLMPPSSSETAAWTMFTYVLGFLLVFRAQLAYSRYWEGLTLLERTCGVWLNGCSNLIAFCSLEKAKQQQVDDFQYLLSRYMSLLMSYSMRDVSRLSPDYFPVLSMDGVDPDTLEYLEETSAKQNVVLQWVQRLVVDNARCGVSRSASCRSSTRAKYPPRPTPSPSRRWRGSCWRSSAPSRCRCCAPWACMCTRFNEVLVRLLDTRPRSSIRMLRRDSTTSRSNVVHDPSRKMTPSWPGHIIASIASHFTSGHSSTPSQKRQAEYMDGELEMEDILTSVDPSMPPAPKMQLPAELHVEEVEAFSLHRGETKEPPRPPLSPRPPPPWPAMELEAAARGRGLAAHEVQGGVDEEHEAAARGIEEPGRGRGAEHSARDFSSRGVEEPRARGAVGAVEHEAAAAAPRADMPEVAAPRPPEASRCWRRPQALAAPRGPAEPMCVV